MELHEMNWDSIGAIGEVIGAIAVLATLIILVFQVKGARAEISLQMIREIKRHNNEDIKFPIKDPKHLQVHIKAQRDYRGLSEEDRLFWSVWLFSWITQTEDAWLARNQGIANMQWVDNYLEGVALVLRSDGGRKVWPNIRGFYDKEFALEVDRAISKSKVSWLDVILPKMPNE